MSLVRQEEHDLAAAGGALDRLSSACHAHILAHVIAVRGLCHHTSRGTRECDLQRQAFRIVVHRRRRLLAPAAASRGSNGDRFKRGQSIVLAAFPTRRLSHGSNARGSPRWARTSTSGVVAPPPSSLVTRQRPAWQGIACGRIQCGDLRAHIAHFVRLDNGTSPLPGRKLLLDEPDGLRQRIEPVIAQRTASVMGCGEELCGRVVIDVVVHGSHAPSCVISTSARLVAMTPKVNASLRRCGIGPATRPPSGRCRHPGGRGPTATGQCRTRPPLPR